ncbi:hypothetical protein D3C86_585260 [compost metagenome]
MGGRAVPIRPECQLARVGARVSQNVLHAIELRLRRHDQYVGRLAYHRHRRKRAIRVVGELFMDGRVHRVRKGGHQQGIAVRRALGHVLRSDDGAAAGSVFHDDRLAQLIRQALGQLARNDVGAAARREGHDDAQGPVRKGRAGLRRRQCAKCQHGHGNSRAATRECVSVFHALSPVYLLARINSNAPARPPRHRPRIRPAPQA